MIPREDSLTDLNVLDIAAQNPANVLADIFRTTAETRHGADWEWYLFDGAAYAGFRLQAKNVNATGNIPELTRAKAREQNGKLLSQSGRLMPFYVLYQDGKPANPVVQHQHCYCSRAHQKYWGCALVRADVVNHLMQAPNFRTRDVVNRARPWHLLVCPPPGGSIVNASHAFASASGLGDSPDSDGSLGLLSDPPTEVRSVFQQMMQLKAGGGRLSDLSADLSEARSPEDLAGQVFLYQPIGRDDEG